MSENNINNKTTSSNDSPPTDIIFILDESGSMYTMEEEAKQSINSFIKDQKDVDPENSTFTLWKFNTKVKCVYDDVPLSSLEEFTDFTPHGLTALFDGIGNAITTKLSKKKNTDVICVILTDGDENASQEYNSDTIKNMIKDMEDKYHWKFIFLGANQDSFTTGSGYGINRQRCANFSSQNTDYNNISHISGTVSNVVRAVRVRGIRNTQEDDYNF